MSAQHGAVPHTERNISKARVILDEDTVLKDFAGRPLPVRLLGRLWLRWEEEALRRLEGVDGVPRLIGRPTRDSLRMSRVPGVPLWELKRGVSRAGDPLPPEFLPRLQRLFAALHERGVAHCDAHFRNILVHDGRPYLVDFSTAYVRGRLPVFDDFVFERLVDLDRVRLHKVEKRFFGRDEPPRMFFLYRLREGWKAMRKKLWDGFSIVAAYAAVWWLAAPTPLTLALGGILVALGAGIRLWAAGHLVRNKELATSGPYAYVRDPLYLGRLLLLVGFCGMGGGWSWVVLPFALGVFFFQYMPRKHRKEMERLRKHFGEEYEAYAAATRSLLPRLTPYPRRSSRRWSAETFFRENREYLFFLGVVLAAWLLVVRV